MLIFETLRVSFCSYSPVMYTYVGDFVLYTYLDLDKNAQLMIVLCQDKELNTETYQQADLYYPPYLD